MTVGGGGASSSRDLPPDLPADLPHALRPLAAAAHDIAAETLGGPALPESGGRESAVLMLLGPGPDLLLIERAAGLRSHPGQPAFPGGAVDPGDG